MEKFIDKIIISNDISLLFPYGKTLLWQFDIDLANIDRKSFHSYIKEAFDLITKQRINFDQIKKIPHIVNTREAYKKIGKDPNRYRPSSEQLLRRAYLSKLYLVSPLVDLGNLISMKSGFSLAVLDRKQIQGDIHLRIGSELDQYQAIGRGALNISKLPVYSDQEGAFASPTSDSLRTSISSSSVNIAVFINDFKSENETNLCFALQEFQKLLSCFAPTENSSVQIIPWK